MYRNAVPNVQANGALHKKMADHAISGDTASHGRPLRRQPITVQALAGLPAKMA
jgi:hypothetical protein